MTASDHMARCQAMRGGVTRSEAAIIASLAAMEKLAIGGEGETHYYYKDLAREAVEDCAKERARADMYADLCRGVAEALGLPTEGEDSSWHDLPAKVKIAVLSRPAPAAPDALRKALEKLSHWQEPDSVTGSGDYGQGLMCGIEDRGLQENGYAAVRYGYDRALERVAEEIDGTIASALGPRKEGEI